MLLVFQHWPAVLVLLLLLLLLLVVLQALVLRSPHHLHLHLVQEAVLLRRHDPVASAVAARRGLDGCGLVLLLDVQHGVRRQRPPLRQHADERSTSGGRHGGGGGRTDRSGDGQDELWKHLQPPELVHSVLHFEYVLLQLLLPAVVLQ